MMIIKEKIIAVMLLTVAIFLLSSMACGVKAGNNRPARDDDDKQGAFHRTPVTVLENLRVDLSKESGDCEAEPGDISVPAAARVRLGVQLGGTSVKEGATNSIEIVGEVKEATYEVSGLTIKAAGGALDVGVTELSLDLTSGSRKNYDFNIASAGTFDILCDGNKVGVFTATE
jgi:hypothetical protein